MKTCLAAYCVSLQCGHASYTSSIHFFRPLPDSTSGSGSYSESSLINGMSILQELLQVRRANAAAAAAAASFNR